VYIIKGLVNLPGLKTRRKGGLEIDQAKWRGGGGHPPGPSLEYKWNEREEFMMAKTEKS
jgi:hypothetical protein